MSKSGHPGTPTNVGKYRCAACKDKRCKDCIDVTRNRVGLEGRICTCPKSH